MTAARPLLDGFRVLDLSTGIAGSYCTKLLADGGAEVVIVEPPGGNPLRQRSVTGASIDERYGGVLFEFLSCAKRSVVVDTGLSDDRALLRSLVEGSDAVVTSEGSPFDGHPELSVESLRALAPHSSFHAISAFGAGGPWSGRPANEFVLQSMSGAAWNHGAPDGPPVMFGGNHGDYAVGTAAALAVLVSRARTLRTGRGEAVDLAGLDVLQLTHSLFPTTFLDLAGRPMRPVRADPIPGIHLARDGWVGFWVTTGQQWLDFCTMLGRDDWYEDRSLGLMENRALRHAELVGAVDEWVADRSVDEIVEFATLLRLPVAPVANGMTLPTLDHFRERGFYTTHPRTGAAQPAVWYSLPHDDDPRSPGHSPALGEHTAHYRAASLRPLLTAPYAADACPADCALPFAGLRIADMTAFWAGPIISHSLALLGADVIHIESAKRPDGIRMAATRPMSEHGWWESSPYFNGTNTAKRGVAIDVQTERGRELVLQLITECDVLIENYSPRVMDHFGFDYEQLRHLRPDLIMLRAPAFGISGPWRDRVGYAPTIDEASGLSWVTGLPEGRPLMIGAASDAVGGMHATIALLLALEHRRRTGEGTLIECPQVRPALNLSAEQVIEWSAHGVLLERVGNRSWVHAPQGVYRALDYVPVFAGVPPDDWVALSVETDGQWTALAGVIGDHDLLNDPTLQTVAGRRAGHDRLDRAIAAWCRQRDATEAAAALVRAGVPATRVIPPDQLAEVESVRSRELYETVQHPVMGDMRIIGLPFRSSEGPRRWHRSAAPCLGQHNVEVLRDILGLSLDEIAALERDEVIGNETAINLGW